jgi:glyoxylase-like metal-dependent hydrolase (beta-lactamase superfamily II)
MTAAMSELRAVNPQRNSRRPSLTALGLMAASFAVTASHARAAEVPGPASQPAFGEPVNLYAPDANVYASHQDGQIHSWHAHGRVWLMAGEPGESNVAVQIGADGLLVVDTGTAAFAPRLLATIQQLAQQHAVDPQAIRMVLNTNGLPDHMSGNGVIRQAGSQIRSGEETEQDAIVSRPGAEVLASQNVLSRLVAESTAGGAYPPRELWPTDTDDFAVFDMHFNGEAVQIYHPDSANTDGQLMIMFRDSDVIAAGDVIDMTGYPVIDVARGGTIDGELAALNQLIKMAVPAQHAQGGTVVIPGHGQLCDQASVRLYANMITVIRNLVHYYKSQGRTLEQVLALEPSAGYDERWGATSGPWTTRDFITAVYQTLPAKGPVLFSLAPSFRSAGAH